MLGMELNLDILQLFSEYSYLLSNLQEVLCVPWNLIDRRKVLLLLKLFRVKKWYMTNNNVCIYQNDYNK